MTSDVGFARPPSNFCVLNLQVQHLVIHDSSSGQLVEAMVPSIDFSQSVAFKPLHDSTHGSPGSELARIVFPQITLHEYPFLMCIS